MPSLVSDLISSAITLSRAASIATRTSSTVAGRLPGVVAIDRSDDTGAPPSQDFGGGLDSGLMPKYGPDRIRNVAIVGHSHEGKTTLAEAMMFAAGALPRMGATEAGTAALDFEPEEQKRKISINLAIGHLEQDGCKINLLDTPGFFDFAGQVDSALAAAEGSLVVVGASPQLSVGTEIAWERLNRNSRARLVVVNKMDKDHADFFGALDAMRAQLTPRPVALHLPIGSEAGFKGVVDLMRMRAVLAGAEGKATQTDVPADTAAPLAAGREPRTQAAA